ncbi:polysaccharide biosynthesis protein [Erythrobacter sp. GH1-10]|uniref:polysaccharide biosynthesis protein n=1 Tax=Erythrobacter sp. GH1-10 TaxID=3349334 RepID=UPI0038782226
MLRRVVLGGVDCFAVLTSLYITASLIFAPSLAEQFFSSSVAAIFVGSAALVFYISGLYNRSWRFFGFGHAMMVVLVSLIANAIAWSATLTMLAKSPGIGFFAAALTHWLLTIALMMGARSLRRSVQEGLKPKTVAKALSTKPLDENQGIALLVGSPQWALSVLDLIKAEDSPNFEVAGVLLPSISDPIDRVGKAKVLGSHDMLVEVVESLALQGRRPTIVIASDDGIHLSQREIARLSHRAKELGLELSRIRDCWSEILLKTHPNRPQELDVKSLLGRNEYKTNDKLIAGQVEGNCVLTTGAGGTIGGELCRQIASFKPSRLVLVDHSEFNLYEIEMTLRERFPDLDIRSEVCNIRDARKVRRVFAEHRPAIVYHAAALKHVPIVESNPCEGVLTNVLGTKTIADAVCEFEARAMVQVSTDKAVNPVGMMGATKRVGELYSQALDMCGVDDPNAPRFMTVRFGNVLGSSGSILPLFQRQLEQGKPLTVTHPDIERFFMTVREAVQLILQSSSFALEKDTERGTIFVLDMGNPVRIIDLAYRLISAYGLEPEVDVPIEIVGLRPGEKLFEELFDNCEEQVDSRLEGIIEARSQPIPLPFIKKSLERLEMAVREGDREEAKRITHHLARLPSSGVKFDLRMPKRSSRVARSLDPV